MSDRVGIMRAIIDALKIKCLTNDEVNQIMRERLSSWNDENLRKRRLRYITRLEKLGLLKKRGNKYCWYIYINDLKDQEDYDLKLLHSRKLIPALRSIAGINLPRYDVEQQEGYVSEADRRILLRCAEDHLRAYPEVWRLLEDYRRREYEVERERELFCSNLMGSLRNEFSKESIVEPRKAKGNRFVVSTVPLQIYNHLLYGSPRLPELQGDEVWFGNVKVAKGSGLPHRIVEFIKRETEKKVANEAVMRIKKIQHEVIEIRRGLEYEIRKLILGIQSSIPIIGGCEICVRAQIISDPF